MLLLNSCDNFNSQYLETYTYKHLVNMWCMCVCVRECIHRHVNIPCSSSILDLSFFIQVPLFLCIDHWRRLYYLFLLFFGTLHSDVYIFPFQCTECIAHVNYNPYPLQNICPPCQGKKQENILHKSGGTVTKSSYHFFFSRKRNMILGKYIFWWKIIFHSFFFSVQSKGSGINSWLISIFLF